MAWDTVKTTEIAKPLPLAERRREVPPPHVLLSAAYYNCHPLYKSIWKQEPRQPQLCSPRYEMHRAEQGRRRLDRWRENTLHSLSCKVHSQCQGKREGYAVSHSSAQGCQCLPIMSRTKLCIFPKVCKAPPGCTLLSSLTSLLPLLVTGSLLSLECWVLACPCCSILHTSKTSCPPSQSPRLSTTLTRCFHAPTVLHNATARLLMTLLHIIFTITSTWFTFFFLFAVSLSQAE